MDGATRPFEIIVLICAGPQGDDPLGTPGPRQTRAGASGSTLKRPEGAVRDGPAAAADGDRAGLDELLDAERLEDLDQCV